MKRLVKALAVSTVAWGIASGASAQSTYGCDNLDGFNSLPSVEGAEGVFYRVNPELRNFHPFSDETVADVARLSQELAQRGTTLVYLPIPPKAMVMTENLPRRAYDYGFEPNLAASVYDDMIKRLRDAGVVVADARSALAAGAQGASEPYFKTDYRLSAVGARLAAQSVAQALNGNGSFAPTGGGFAQAPIGKVEVDSDMRQVLQRRCLIELPKVETDQFAAPQVQSVNARPGFGANIALVGTEYSATPEVNFAGFLQTATGMPVTQISLDGGGAFGAFSAFVTSDAFQQGRPNVIVWENPVYNNLAQFGDQPFRELIAAASSNCSIELPVMASLEGSVATADLSVLDPGQDFTLYVDTGGSTASIAQFVFQSMEGLSRTKTVVRSHPDARTGRFYVPMSGLWNEGARTVDIQINTSFSGTPRVSACYY